MIRLKLIHRLGLLLLCQATLSGVAPAQIQVPPTPAPLPWSGRPIGQVPVTPTMGATRRPTDAEPRNGAR